MSRDNTSIVYIAGGSGLIGSEIVLRLSNYFDKIIILDISKPKNFFLNKSKNILFTKIDLGKLITLETSLNKIIKKYGVPDIFINASYPVNKNWNKCNFKKIKINYFIQNLNLHLISYCWSSKIIADKMKLKKTSSIILLSSIYGILAQDPKLYSNSNLSENMVYPIIKGGIISHCKQLASMYAAYGVRVNCISPGGIEGSIKGKKVKQDRNFKKKYLEKVPLNRFCKPKDIAEMCLYLSKSNSSYITGQNLVLDGGLSII
jgi:NAD(P)-dependent dehydrogenase (short-subunit alcohol dehydrogenase family)